MKIEMKSLDNKKNSTVSAKLKHCFVSLFVIPLFIFPFLVIWVKSNISNNKRKETRQVLRES